MNAVAQNFPPKVPANRSRKTQKHTTSRKKATSKALRGQKTRNNTLRRKEKMCQQIMKLYEVERKRLDDCIADVAENWCYEFEYIEKVWYNRPAYQSGYHHLLTTLN